MNRPPGEIRQPLAHLENKTLPIGCHDSASKRCRQEVMTLSNMYIHSTMCIVRVSAVAVLAVFLTTAWIADAQLAGSTETGFMPELGWVIFCWFSHSLWMRLCFVLQVGLDDVAQLAPTVCCVQVPRARLGELCRGCPRDTSYSRNSGLLLGYLSPLVPAVWHGPSSWTSLNLQMFTNLDICRHCTAWRFGRLPV